MDNEPCPPIKLGCAKWLSARLRALGSVSLKVTCRFPWLTSHPMANQKELHGPLTGLDATMLERWSSVWADLQAADMALFERGKLNDSKGANLFHRRALWESAVASYGRCAVSGKRRKIP